MGEAKKGDFDRERRMAFRKTVPARLLKGIVGFIFAPIVWFVMLPIECYNRNKWPWEL